MHDDRTLAEVHEALRTAEPTMHFSLTENAVTTVVCDDLAYPGARIVTSFTVARDLFGWQAALDWVVLGHPTEASRSARLSYCPPTVGGDVDETDVPLWAAAALALLVARHDSIVVLAPVGADA